MPKQIRMPKLSDTMEEGRLIAWRKKVGDPVKRGEVLAEIETDKADMEFEAYTEGTLAQIVVEAGATVPVGTLIAVLRLPGESEDAVAAAGARGAQPQAAAPAAAPSARRAEARGAAAPRPAAASRAEPPRGRADTGACRAAARAVRPRVSAPLVAATTAASAPRRARAASPRRSRSISSELTGTGPAGAILASDLEAYLAPARGPGARQRTASARPRSRCAWRASAAPTSRP